MKIALLTNRFPPTLDGVGDYSCHLAGELQRQGHEVSVICRQQAVTQQAIDEGQFNIPVQATIPAWNWQAIHPLWCFIKQHQPDWFLVQYVPNSFQRWAMPIWLPILLWLVKRRGVNVAIVFHEVQIRVTYWPAKYALVTLVQRLVCLMLTHVADVLITSIDLYASMLRCYTGKPIHIVPIASNILPVSVADDELTALRQTIATDGQWIISTFGLRNQDMLLRVFDKVSSALPTTKLLICSQLKISTTLSIYNRLKDQIIVSGFMAAPDVYRYLRVSDVFFLPDLVDKKGKGGTCNKSTALAAALAAGLPVVGTQGDMNNVLLLLIPGLSLHDCQNELAMADTIIRQFSCTDNQVLRESILAFSNTHLNWQAITRQQLDSIESFSFSH